MSDVEQFTEFLSQGDNPREWARLCEALSLTDRFALFLLLVGDEAGESLLATAIESQAATTARRVVRARADELGTDSPVQQFLRIDPRERALLLLTTLRASSSDPEALERSLVQLNGRRDQLAARARGPLVILLRADALRTLVDVAPDLYSVHASQFRFGSRPEQQPAPAWLLLPFEAVGVLGVDPVFGPADRSGMPSLIDDPPEPTEPLLDRDVELGLIEDRILGGARRLRLIGEPGVGRSALARAILDRNPGRWDHVTWVAGRVAATPCEVLHAIVADLADEHELPPVHMIDLEMRYRELTAQRRALIVVDEMHDISLPEPTGASLLIAISETLNPLAEDIFVRPLSELATLELWSSVTERRPPASLFDATKGVPAKIRLAGRWMDVGIIDASDFDNPKMSMSQLLESHASDSERETLALFLHWLWYARRIPLSHVTHDSAATACLVRAGLATLDGAAVVATEDALVDSAPHIDHTIEAIAKEHPPFLEIEKRALLDRSLGCTVDFDDDDDIIWPDSTAIPALVAALPPPLRPEFLSRHPSASNSDRVLHALQAFSSAHLRAAVDKLSAAGGDPQDIHLATLLAELRPPHGSRAAAARALYAWEQCGGMDELSPQTRSELRRALHVRDETVSTESDELCPRFVGVVRDLGNDTTPGIVEFLRETATSTAELPLRHLAWSALAWLHIQQLRMPEAHEALAQVEITARAWATPFALLRLRLLRLEFDLRAGDLLAAASTYEAVLQRTQQLFGQIHEVTTTVLASGVEIHAGTAHLERARQLADECWRQLQYTDSVRKHPLATLARFYAEHGPDTRAQAIAARWQQAFPDHPCPPSARQPRA